MPAAERGHGSPPQEERVLGTKRVSAHLGYETGPAGFQKFGEYDGIAIDVAWYDDLLTEQGHVRPGPR